MYQLYYFLHIVGIILWIGAFISLGVMLTSAYPDSKAHQHLLLRTTSLVDKVLTPASLVVLLSGIFMLIKLKGAKPFYITFMEQAGSLIILATIIVLTWQSRKIKKGVQQNSTGDIATKYSSSYTRYLFSSAFLGLVVIAVVAFRL